MRGPQISHHPDDVHLGLLLKGSENDESSAVQETKARP